jgi:DNA invertase Pin-like site-specific DNA recombinase
MATATMQALDILQPSVQRKFTVELPEALAVSLQEWFERSGDGGNINSFFAQVCELPIIEFRLGDLPPSEQEPRSLVREKLNASQKEELFEIYDEGEVNIAVLAERFGVGRTTVVRIIKAREVATGVVTKPKQPLDQQQIQEIVKLRHLGISVHDIARQFNRTTACVYQIVRNKKSEAACTG